MSQGETDVGEPFGSGLNASLVENVIANVVHYTVSPVTDFAVLLPFHTSNSDDSRRAYHPLLDTSPQSKSRQCGDVLLIFMLTSCMSGHTRSSI